MKRRSRTTPAEAFAYSILRSFWYALRGIFYAVTRERNLRIHFTAAALVLYLMRFYALSTAETALLVLCMGFVVVCEMINTAIEKTVDLETPVYHYLAKIAKDVAAGAVLVSAATSVAVGLLLFWDIPTLKLIGYHVMQHPAQWLLAAAAAIWWIVFPVRLRP